MKKLSISLVLLIVAAGIFLLRARTSGPTSMAFRPRAAEVVTMPAEIIKTASSTQIDHNIDMQERISQIRTLSMKALLSKDEATLLVGLLSDDHLQNQIFEILYAEDTAAFNAAHERDRMEMVGLLNLIVKQKSVEGREAVIVRAVERVISLDFNAIKDMKQKKSVLGDTVEIIQILKSSEPEAYEAVKNSITRLRYKPLTRALVLAG